MGLGEIGGGSTNQRPGKEKVEPSGTKDQVCVNVCYLIIDNLLGWVIHIRVEYEERPQLGGNGVMIHIRVEECVSPCSYGKGDDPHSCGSFCMSTIEWQLRMIHIRVEESGDRSEVGSDTIRSDQTVNGIEP
ncbi:hypothetical protein E3N88_13721 [Mikania micrantha]|uniref:Uncharacterized protein n=1 Tax=Mikania micrantha TaxID=192012 RepID=A0A5N6P130_9ASTR|nr:hypothetical protein E3N88_13721 [Mikania micrantha]